MVLIYFVIFISTEMLEEHKRSVSRPIMLLLDNLLDLLIIHKKV